MDKEQVGRKAWLHTNDQVGDHVVEEISLRKDGCYYLESDEVIEGVFLTTQQRDDLIAGDKIKLDGVKLVVDTKTFKHHLHIMLIDHAGQRVEVAPCVDDIVGKIRGEALEELEQSLVAQYDEMKAQEFGESRKCVPVDPVAFLYGIITRVRALKP